MIIARGFELAHERLSNRKEASGRGLRLGRGRHVGTEEKKRWGEGDTSEDGVSQDWERSNKGVGGLIG